MRSLSQFSIHNSEKWVMNEKEDCLIGGDKFRKSGRKVIITILLNLVLCM